MYLTILRYLYCQVLRQRATFLAAVAVYEEVVMRLPPTLDGISLPSVNGWIVIMSRVDANFPAGSMPFEHYKTGFSVNGNIGWLGLEAVHQLTSGGANCKATWRIRFELQSATNAK